jgi:lipid-A-disaccharide synthase-like uncharacterized protein
MLFTFCIPIVIFPKAYTENEFWAISILSTLIYLCYYFYEHFNQDDIVLIVFFSGMIMLNCGSLYLSEVGENNMYVSGLKTTFPRLYSCFFLEEDVEISKKKLVLRLMNVIVCIGLLLYGNEWIVNYLHIDNVELKKAMDIVSLYFIGYFSVSVINQWYMIYMKGIEYQKV